MLVKVSDIHNSRSKGTATALAKSKTGNTYPISGRDTAGQDTAAAMFALPTATSIVDGFFAKDDHISMRALCRDMFMYDPICGGAIELYSSLPFGQFSLSGLPEAEMIDKHHECLQAMKVDSLFTPITVDYLVDGAPIGALSVDPKRKIVDHYIPFNADDCTLHFSPMHDDTPLVDVKFPEEYRRVFAKKNDARVEALKARIPEIIRKELIDGGMKELNPENTVYIGRDTQSFNQRGVSLLTSLLPYWILEKALLRGTIQMAYRRQRGILVIQMGSDTWPTTKEEMDLYVDQVISADRDPHGAVIALRQDVMFQEIRQGGDFWKHGDSMDVYNQLKMKALGISDSAFSGDTNMSATADSMTIFNQRLRQLRERMVTGLLYRKVFPITSKLNDYTRDNIDTATWQDIAAMTPDSDSIRKGAFRYSKDRDGRFVSTAAEITASDNKFYIPSLNFHNSLRPEASSEYMQTLDTLSKMGVPIPLRTIIGAVGLSVGDILAGQDEDIGLWKAFDSYRKKTEKFKPKLETNDYSAYQTEYDSFSPAASRQRGIAGRRQEFEAYNDIASFNENGKRIISTRGKRLIDERRNRNLAGAAAEAARRHNLITNKRHAILKEQGRV